MECLMLCLDNYLRSKKNVWSWDGTFDLEINILRKKKNVWDGLEKEEERLWTWEGRWMFVNLAIHFHLYKFLNTLCLQTTKDQRDNRRA